MHTFLDEYLSRMWGECDVVIVELYLTVTGLVAQLATPLWLIETTAPFDMVCMRSFIFAKNWLLTTSRFVAHCSVSILERVMQLMAWLQTQCRSLCFMWVAKVGYC